MLRKVLTIAATGLLWCSVSAFASTNEEAPIKFTETGCAEGMELLGKKITEKGTLNYCGVKVSNGSWVASSMEFFVVTQLKGSVPKMYHIIMGSQNNQDIRNIGIPMPESAPMTRQSIVLLVGKISETTEKAELIFDTPDLGTVKITEADFKTP